MHLVIVESPTKAKTIRKFLGSEYKVLASMGHIRDLPASSSDVPAALKKTPWGQLGVNVEGDFEPLYVIPKNKTKTITEIKQALKEADKIYLATDEDREGESISFHLLEVLKPKVPVLRMVFHEITKQAIEAALDHPREIDENLVRAQETRRILDRLVGYTISPVLWKKIAYGLSAGRVQSAALKAIIDRERSRMAFNKGSYWDVSANLDKGGAFEGKLYETEGKRIASGKDFDEQTGTLKKEQSALLLLDEAKAKKIAEASKAAAWKIADVTEKPMTRRPPPPFITSTLQQESNRKLGLSSKETMRTAQSLYEHGLITYMRTDSTALSTEAVSRIKKMVQERYGAEFAAEHVHQSGPVKGAQEAHEAIRPSLDFALPADTALTGAERDLYELIWMRTIASQMTDARQMQVTVTLHADKHVYRASGLKILFAGFMRAYAEGSDDPEEALEQKERLLPDMKVGDAVTCVDTLAAGHETKPPARFTEAGLIQFMEKEGIGRPSTYASIISTLMDRGYVRKTSGALVPTFTGFAVTQFMERHFADLVDTKFTSTMEESLDKIAEGKEEWLPYLKRFYRGEHGLEKRVEEEKQAEDTVDSKRIDLPKLSSDIVIHVGKFGPYFEATHPKSGTRAKASIPEDVAPGDFSQAMIEELLNQTQQGPTSLGADPATGKLIFLRTGSYGPYLQLGEDEEQTGEKPKRASIPKGIALETLDLQKAISIIALPRTLGNHPESGKPVKAGLGRFGPYIVHDNDFRSLKGEDDVLTVTIERALELLAIPKGTRGGKAGVPAKTLGAHSKDKKPVTIQEGKYGWYVKHGRTNASLPKETNHETYTLEEAVALLATKKTKRKSNG